jgi:very-short-patch-repair endonuclease
LVRRQHFVVTHGQLLALGFTAEAIRHRVRKGRLHRLWRGVYSVHRPPGDVTRHGWFMAAVLACGEGALLSHHSAAELLAIRRRRAGPFHVSVPLGARRALANIEPHQRRSIAGGTCEGIPVTSPIDTPVNEADKLRLVDPETLRKALDGLEHRPGVAPLRETLDVRTYSMTDTQLERRFLPIPRRIGMPKPETQVRLNGFRVDFHWPELGLVVETDGLTYHRTPAQQAEDRVRDQVHTAAGRVPLRFTRAQVRYDPGHVERILRAVFERLQAAR